MIEDYKNGFVLTLAISLQNYSKFKAPRNLFLTKAKIIKITPYNSLSLIKQLDNFNDLLLTCVPFRSHDSSVDVSKIRTRIGGQTSINVSWYRLTRTIIWVVELESGKKLLDCSGTYEDSCNSSSQVRLHQKVV